MKFLLMIDQSHSFMFTLVFALSSVLMTAQDSTGRRIAIEEASNVAKLFSEIDTSAIALEIQLDAGTDGASSHGSGILLTKPRNGHMRIIKSDYFSHGLVNYTFDVHSSDLFHFHMQQFSHLDSSADPVDALKPYLIKEQTAVVFQYRLLAKTSWTKPGFGPFKVSDLTTDDILSEYWATERLIDQNCDTCPQFIETSIKPWLTFSDKMNEALPPHALIPSGRPSVFPLKDGTYEFVLRWAEHPVLIGPRLYVTIKGDSIYVDEVNEVSELSGRFKESGLLLWHEATK